MLQDAHCHVQDVAEDQEQLLSASRQAGVRRFFCCAASPLEWELLRELSLRDVRICPFYGVHPWYAGKEFGDWLPVLRDIVGSGGAGIGEIGLDAARTGISLQAQEAIFAPQLDLAVALGKPVAIHCLRAWPALFALVEPRQRKGLRFMVHAFSGTAADLEKLIALGGYVSFSLRFVLTGSQKLCQLSASVPPDRLLVETDFPYLLPAGCTATAQGYAALLRQGYELLAQIRRVPADDLIRMVWENGTLFTH